MEWNNLTDSNQLEMLTEQSYKTTVLVFKHSTRCSISTAALDRLERKWESSLPVNVFYLDLIKYRPISAKIEADFKVEHQSPQVLLIQNGQCFYDASHTDIRFEEIKNQLALGTK